MADLAIQQVSQAGLNPSFVAANVGGDIFSNDGGTWLHVKNGGASAVTVTIDSKQQCNHGFDHDLTVSVPASSERIVGPFSVGRFNDQNTGKVSVSYSVVTSVTVAAVKM